MEERPIFRKNKRHLQPLQISNVNDLPTKQSKRLEKSWAGVFYQEFFCHLKEEPFAVLYADIPSRPNIPVNVLVALEYLKAGHGWSDEELYDGFIYNMQVRYALGYHQLGEGDFELRTLYNFRQRLNRYMQESGINLLDQAFAQVTDEQIAAFKLKTGKQRMDSTQVASNNRKMGHLQLLVEVLQTSTLYVERKRSGPLCTGFRALSQRACRAVCVPHQRGRHQQASAEHWRVHAQSVD
ncbi:MAG TPA: hypothetical protein ENI05_03955 [Porticoccus sp.]|nr:hypothetical protein [Porticoccus sp.]